MKLTKAQLKEIIKEEIDKAIGVVTEQEITPAGDLTTKQMQRILMRCDGAGRQDPNCKTGKPLCGPWKSAVAKWNKDTKQASDARAQKIGEKPVYPPGYPKTAKC